MNATEDLREITQLVGDAVAELTNLIQTEVALTRSELSQKAQLAKTGAMLIAAGAVFIIPAAVLLLMALGAGLDAGGVPAGWSDLIAAVIGAAAGGGLIVYGASRLSGGAMAPSVTLGEMRRDKTLAKELIR